MKKLFSIEILCFFVTTVALLLSPSVSAANNYVLKFKTPEHTIELYLTVDPDTDPDQLLETQGQEEQLNELLPGENRDNQGPETVGGLPVSGPAPFPQSQPSGLTAAGQNACQEHGAVGGLPAPLVCRVSSQPVSNCPRPVTSQPGFNSRPSIDVPTGNHGVRASVERLESDVNVPLHIQEGQLKAFVRLFAALAAMEADQMYTNPHFTRCGNCINTPAPSDATSEWKWSCGDLVCDSVVNPSWRYWKYGIGSLLGLTGTGTGVAFGTGAITVGAIALPSGFLLSGLVAFVGSYTEFPNQLQVSFTFDSQNLDIDRLQQIRIMLQCSGSYHLLSYSMDGNSQTLTFNVQTTNAVDADQLSEWLDESNLQFENAFNIEVSSTSTLTDGAAPTELADGAASIELTEETPPADSTEEATPIKPTEETPLAGSTEKVTPIEPTEEATSAYLTEETPAGDSTEKATTAYLTEETSTADPTEETSTADLTEETSTADLTGETAPAYLTEETAPAYLTEETPAADPTEDTASTNSTEEADKEVESFQLNGGSVFFDSTGRPITEWEIRETVL
ncbi:hypothetical protein [Endozoicomonas sp. 4G]|uniref:hypothetical protein n=1 Tax=Endozoicomonas sp. 4G TaxID=2872754 RepID=UPI002078DDE5|nr:hypothetical protein [Endozoicomonas sp. 4G]